MTQYQPYVGDSPDTGGTAGDSGTAGSGAAAAPPPVPDAGAPVCYRHPDRETYIRCQRCGRSICPEDMSPASVGFQCPVCVHEGRATVRRPRTVLGGALRARDSAVTTTVIAICVLVYGAGLVVPDLTLRYALLGGGRFLTPTGAVDGVAGGAWWRLVTGAFLHANLLHLGVNMLSLWILGRPLEAALGRLRFGALYLVGLLGSSAVAYLLTSPAQPVVGASGAIFALLGAMLVLSRRLGIELRGLVGILVVNFVITFVGAGYGISWQAHLGGFIAGVVIGAGLLLGARVRRGLLAWTGFAVVAVGAAVVIAVRTAQLT